jgi:hypothetical protein
MCIGTHKDCGCIDLLDDPLIRLVMESDGVSENETAALMERVRQVLLSSGRKTPLGRLTAE